MRGKGYKRAVRSCPSPDLDCVCRALLPPVAGGGWGGNSTTTQADAHARHAAVVMMRPADMRTESERGGIKKLIGKTKFPANFKEKVNMSKVNMETMAPWIQSEVEKYVGFDDDVLVGYVQSQLVPPDGSPVDPRAVQMNLMGFLEKHTSTFMAELCALTLAPTLAPTLTSPQP